MEITIKDNDALEAVSLFMPDTKKDIIQKIISDLTESEFLMEPTEEVGMTIQEMVDEFGHQSLDDAINATFPIYINNQEFREVFSAILFWGDGSEHPCELCGCEMDGEEDGADGRVWTDWKCSNSNCEGAETNEPDWDCMPGGKDDY